MLASARQPLAPADGYGRNGGIRKLEPAAWLSTVIHHVPDLTTAARELRRVLRPDGPVPIRSAFAGRHHAIPPASPQSRTGPADDRAVAS